MGVAKPAPLLFPLFLCFDFSKYLLLLSLYPPLPPIFIHIYTKNQFMSLNFYLAWLFLVQVLWEHCFESFLVLIDCLGISVIN